MLRFFARRLKQMHEKDEKGEKGFTLILIPRSRSGVPREVTGSKVGAVVRGVTRIKEHAFSLL